MTQAVRSYRNPPVAEAILDFRVDAPPTLEALNECSRLLVSDFPTQAPITTLSIELDNSGATSSQGDTGHGFRLASADESSVVQIKSRGFTFSQLNHYGGWDDFHHRAASAWQKFFESCKPQALNRIAVRFINKIVIPQSTFEFTDYFNVGYQIPKNIPDVITGVFLQMQIPQPDLHENAICVLSLWAGGQNDLEAITIMLDFDIFVTGNFAPNSDEMWQIVNGIRGRKNMLFEACITDKTRSLFE